MGVGEGRSLPLPPSPPFPLGRGVSWAARCMESRTGDLTSMSPLSPTLTSTCISLKVESVVSLSSDGLVLCIVEGEPPRLRVAGGTGSICEKDGCAADTCRVGDKTGRERSSGRAGRRVLEARRVRDAIELRRGQVRSDRGDERAKTTAGSARCGRLRIGAVERGCSISMH